MVKKKNAPARITGLETGDPLIRPTSDIFNAVFWSAPKNEWILRGFLNAVLRDGGAVPITEATVLNPFNIKEFAVEKSLVLDVRVRDELDRRYNIEVQTTPHTGFRNRALLYWADFYSGLLRTGDEYSKLVPVKSVIIIEFPIFPELRNLHAIFEARSRENPAVVLTDHFQMHFLRLGDMLKRQMEGLGELDRGLQHWMNFFAFGDKLPEDEMSQLVEHDKLIQSAYEQFRHFTADEQMRERVRLRQRFLEDQKIYLDAARDEGRDQGKIEGKIEEKIEIARSMKSKGCDLDFILEITGLSREEVERLQ